MKNIAIVSGGFDPIHSGHLDMLEEAAKYGDVMAVINSDEFLTRKKGKPFMEYNDRMRIVRALRVVKWYMHGKDDDDTICDNLRMIRDRWPADKYKLLFCNGGDRTATNVPEQEVCEELGIKTFFKVGGKKTQSSSDILKQWSEEPQENQMFIKIDLRDDVELDEAVAVARAIIDTLDDAEKIPDQITEISLGGYPDIWVSDGPGIEENV